MANTYDVTPQEVAAELGGLFPSGFAVSTVPTITQVQSWIDTADAIISTEVFDASGTYPALTDKLETLAEQYIKEYTKEQVVRVIYAGNDPAKVKAATDPYVANQDRIVAALKSFRSQATGTATNPVLNVGVSYETAPYDPTVTDDMLGGLGTDYPRTRKF